MQKKKSFLKNTATLFIAMIITKILGAVLKIPLGNILGGEGMGYFTTAYSIFTPVLAFACSGIPMIVTRTVAGYCASNQYGRIYELRKASLILSLILGFAGTVVIMTTAVPFVVFIANSPDSLISVLIIAPTVMFCSVTAVYRGYYEGLSDTFPTAVSQVIEASVKAVLGILLSYYVYSNGIELFGSLKAALPYSAAAAVLGVSLSELCGTIYMILRSRNRNDNISAYKRKIPHKDIIELMKYIFVQSLPVSIGAAASNLLSFADMLTVSNCINLSINIFGVNDQFNHIISSISAENGEDIGNFMYGCYAGMVMSVYMLASAASVLVGRSILPRLSYSVKISDNSAIKENIKILVKGTTVITAPISVFTAVLSEPLLKLLYPVRELETSISVLPLQILSISGIAGGIGGALFVIFNAYGDFRTPLIVTLVSGFVKLLFNVLLVTVPGINIAGASLSTLISNIVCIIYSGYLIKKRLKLDSKYTPMCMPSLISSFISGAGMIWFYHGLYNSAGLLQTLVISFILGSIMYVLLLFIFDSKDFSVIISSIRHKERRKT